MIGALSNHLWQSTVFAIVAAILTVAFRKNRAHVRYWLWLAASLKFLVPFALLMGLGATLWSLSPARKITTGTAPPAVSFTVEEITQPFPAAVSFVPTAPRATNWLPVALVAVWLSGLVTLVSMRLRDWLRIRTTLRRSTPLEIPTTVPVRSSPGLLEPGVVGFLRPTLLLPQGILSTLTASQLETVLAHELSHIRRRDNLTAALHMIVEALFWFYPLVWWIGGRLVEERERACDEEVLQLGNDPQVYAQGILNVCKFYVESPLTCLSGITGSDLGNRVERILKQQSGAALSTRKKFLLATASIVVLVAPLAGGVLTSTRPKAQSLTTAENRPRFDAASVKVNKSGSPGTRDTLGQSGGYVTETNATLQYLIARAYYPYYLNGAPNTARFLAPWLAAQPPGTSLDLAGPRNIRFLIFGIPKWADSERFDISARAEGAPTVEQKQLMLRSLLADRFSLTAHRETRQLPVFALVLSKPGKTGLQLTRHTNDTKCFDATGPAPPGTAMPPCGSIFVKSGSGSLFPEAYGVTMDSFAANLSGLVGRIVVNRTGLSGTFDLNFGYTPEAGQPGPLSGPVATDPSSQPGIFTALQDQLGLKLESTTGPVDVLVIDHVEEPSPN